MNRQTNRPLTAHTVLQLRLQAAFMSFVVLFLLICALAALSRLPEILAEREAGWQLKVAGTVLFNVLVVVGIMDNVLSHRSISHM